MNVLNTVCFVSALIFVSALFLLSVGFLGSSIYACFTKKVKGSLVSKICCVIIFGCTCPWILKVLVMLIEKLGA